MNIILDILFAFILVGMLILSAYNVDTNVKRNAIAIRNHLTAQKGASIISLIFEEELRKIGHGLRQPTNAISAADTSRIVFAYDQNWGTTFDSVRIEYKINDNFSPPNPGQIQLVRIKNGVSNQYYSLGLTRFKMAYYNQKGEELVTPVPSDSLGSIKQIEVLMDFEGPVELADELNTARYISRITPKNMLVQYGRD